MMAEQRSQDQETIDSQISNWSNYSKHRPRYPDSLTNLIMDYHRAHSDSFRLAHDVGSGPGIFATTLADFFSHVHVSDPSASSVELARENLSQWRARNLGKSTFSFDVQEAETADKGLPAAEVDLVTVMEAAHLVQDIDSMVQAVARQLSPNGTMAVVVYNPAVHVIGEGSNIERMRAAVKELFRRWTSEVLKAPGGANSVHVRKVFPQNQVGVDFIPVPEGPFIQEATKRIRINTHGRGDESFEIPGVEHLADKAASRVRKEHKLYEFATGEDVEAEGWKMEVDVEWFRGYIESLGQDGKMNLYAKELEQVESIAKEALSTRKITVEWAVGVLLATKK